MPDSMQMFCNGTQMWLETMFLWYKSLGPELQTAVAAR